jgi:transposase-like protein
MTENSPFERFKTSPEIIRLVVMMYVRFPLSLRNVEDLLHERGVEISHETVRFWWHRFGPRFAAEIRKRRIEGSYGPALKALGTSDLQRTGRWLNNRAENSHLPFRRRERAMLRFRRMRSLQKFASVHASVANHFNSERSLSSRPLFKANRAAALDE